MPSLKGCFIVTLIKKRNGFSPETTVRRYCSFSLYPREFSSGTTTFLML